MTDTALNFAETVHFLLGASCDQKKLQLSSSPVILGVTFNLEDFFVEIDAILEAGTLDPGTAGNLNGKLMFGSSQLWGQVGQGLFRPLSERQYSKDLASDRRELIEALAARSQDSRRDDLRGWLCSRSPES